MRCGTLPLLTTYGEHGMFGYNIIFLLNVIVFNMSLAFDIWLNALLVLISGFVFLFEIKKSLESHNGLFYKFIVLIWAFISFGLMQGSSSAMDTQVRLGLFFFILQAYMVSKALLQPVSTKYLCALAFVTFLSINIFGTMYSFGGIGGILLITAIAVIAKKKLAKAHVIIAVSNIICAVLYFVQYSAYGKGTATVGVVGNAAFSIINELGVFAKGLLVYNGSVVLGHSIWADNVVSINMYMLVGLFVTMIYIYAIVQYFLTKMHEKTLVPMLFLLYTFFIFVMVALSRSHHWSQFVGSWYQVHTKPGAIAVTWILLYAFKQNSWLENVRVKWSWILKRGFKVVTSVFCVALVSLMVFGNAITLRRAPAVKNYIINMQPYLFLDPDEMPVDENGQTPLLNSASQTNRAIEIMRKYRLSVYQYEHSYDIAQSMVTSSLSNAYLNSKCNRCFNRWPKAVL
jgi:hypothetical protein